MSRSKISKQKENAVNLIKLKDKLDRRIATLTERRDNLIRVLDAQVKALAEKEVTSASSPI